MLKIYIFIGDNIVCLNINQMSKRQRYPQQTNYRQKPIKKEPCGQGWHCPDILPNKCSNLHDDEDIKYAKKLKLIKEQSQTIIILDTYDKNLSPICLLYPSLLINIVNQKEIKMEVGKYYQANLLDIQKPKSIDFKISKEIGHFGKWQVQQDLLYKYFPREYELQKPQKETQMGEVKINGQLKKVVTIHQGKKIYFQKVNKSCIYPLLGGCKVSYYEKGNTIGVTKVNYPHQVKLCGIVQIDNNSQFYFISRNQQYDDMNPYALPKQMEEKLVQFKGLFPYSLLKYQSISKEQQTKINTILKQYLVKGRFKGWPLSSRFPIIQLIDQINVKNFKSLKDGIIYQAGISMTPFDKKEKQDSQKIVKNFKIQDFQKTRKTLNQQIFTVDNKQTKCHDDALSIIKLKDGNFLVEIHIADVAALINQEDAIDKKIKKRDETIYIKNYYQPMLYDSLKNLLSLSAEQDKLAFTLSFEVNPEGYIDYRTVQFHKNIINVTKNLAHERIQIGKEQYPQLKQLNTLFDKSKLIDNNYILQSQTNSQVAISRLIFISSIIPTYLLEINIQRAKIFKEQFQQYLKKIIDQRKNDMEKWEKVLDNVKQLESEQNQFKKSLKIIQKKIDVQLDKQRKTIMKRLKQQQNSNKIIAGKIKVKVQSDQSQSEDLNQLTQQINQADQQRQRIEDEQQKEIQKNNQIQMIQKQKRTKALKEVKIEDLQSSSSESEHIQEQSEDDVLQNEQFRMNAAVGGKKYLEKVFKNPIFNIDIKWTSFQEINNAFKTILSKDKGKLYQQYFKRMQVINRQHFKYIVRMEKQKNAGEYLKEYKQEQNSNKQRRRYDRKDREQKKYDRNKKKQEKPEDKNTKKDSVKQQSIIQEQNNITSQNNQKKDKRQKRRNEYNKKQKFQQKKGQKGQKNNLMVEQPPKQVKKNISENTEVQISKKSQRQEVNKTKQSLELYITKKIKRLVQQKSEYYIDKYHLPYKQGEKLQFSSDQQQQQNLQILAIKKDVKRKMILRLLIRSVQKQKTNEITEDKNAKGKRLQLMVKNIKEYMENKSQEYIQKYQKQFIKDSRFKNLDISFNESDQKYIIADIDQEKYKKQKVVRLKAIFKKYKKQAQKSKQVKTQKIFNKDKNLPKEKEVKQQTIKQGEDQTNPQLPQPLKEIPVKKEQILPTKQSEQLVLKEDVKQTKGKKLTKKGLKKKIEEQIEPFLKELNQKYKDQKENLKLKLQQIKLKIKQQRNILLEDLQSVHYQYNLLKLLTYQDQSQKSNSKKQAKKKKKQKQTKNKNEQKVQKSTILQQFLDNFKHYAQKAGFKFKQMKTSELDDYLSNILQLKKICEDSNSQIRLLNAKASKKGQNQQQLLKWNNPIRSYESLTVMRMIKYYKWLFQGEIFPTDIIRYYSDIKEVQKKVKQLQDYRAKKVEKGELNKKVKQSNRQISKLQFYNLLKRDLNATFDFLNIGSPCPEKVKFVFHPILEQVEVNNLNFKQEIYKEVKGKVIIVREFPLKFRINLQK